MNYLLRQPENAELKNKIYNSAAEFIPESPSPKVDLEIKEKAAPSGRPAFLPPTASKEDVDFFNGVIDYFSRNRTKLYILTPVYGGMVYLNYMTRLFQTRDLFSHLNIQIELKFTRNESLITRARNNLMAKSLSDPEMTHILFIDADITWEPVDIIKLLMSEKGLNGGIYPMKRYNWKLLNKDAMSDVINRKNKNAYLKNLTDEQMVYHNMLSYNFNFNSNVLTIEKNVTEVKYLATGFMMIRRQVLLDMIKEYPETKYVDDSHFLEVHENKYAYALFDCIIQNGRYLSEDFTFCDRWKKMGGKVYADVSINLTHTGQEDFNGMVSSILF